MNKIIKYRVYETNTKFHFEYFPRIKWRDAMWLSARSKKEIENFIKDIEAIGSVYN